MGGASLLVAIGADAGTERPFLHDASQFGALRLSGQLVGKAKRLSPKEEALGSRPFLGRL